MEAGVKKARLEQLEVLIAEAGSIKLLGEAVRRAAVERRVPKAAEKDYANVVSQLRGGKPIGDKLAKLLGVSMGKPDGWMDGLLAVDQIMEAKEAGQIAMNMTEDKRALWLQMGRIWAQDGPPSKGRPFDALPPGHADPAPPKKKAETTKRAPKPKRRRKGGGNA